MDSIVTASKLGCKKFVGAGSISQYELEITGSNISPGEKSPRLINSMIRILLSSKHQSLNEDNQIFDFISISDQRVFVRA